MPSSTLRRCSARALAAALVLLPATGLRAQVGFPPAESPYRDLDFRQDLSVFSGWLSAKRDLVGVAPQSAPIVGVRWDLHIGGPAWFSVRAAGVASQRTVIDPRRSVATRVLGEESSPFGILDANILVHLTGQKSWHRIVPVVGAGLGVASDFKSSRDVGNYQFGTPFAFNLGGGVRYVPSGRWSVRVDVTDYLYRIKYPDLYRIQASDGTQVLGDTDPSSQWTHNVALTFGASYQLFR
jgi:hypothetical protein